MKTIWLFLTSITLLGFWSVIYADNIIDTGINSSIQSSSPSSLGANQVQSPYFYYQTPPLVQRRDSDFDMNSGSNWLSQSTRSSGQVQSMYPHTTSTLKVKIDVGETVGSSKKPASMYLSDKTKRNLNGYEQDTASAGQSSSLYHSYGSMDTFKSSQEENEAADSIEGAE
jgi:hypothetical protein